MQGTLPFVEIPPQRALVLNQQKLIQWPHNGRTELYNLGEDPVEHNPLPSDNALDGPTLPMLEAHTAEAPKPPGNDEIEINEDFDEHLRAIGYL
jgi:hypothetical protein